MNTWKIYCVFFLVTSGFYSHIFAQTNTSISSEEGILGNVENTTFLLALGILAMIILGTYILRKIRSKLDASLVVPVILELKPNKKRSKLKAKIKIPVNDKPAKFTIYTESGKPLQDLVVPPSKRRISLGIQELQQGKYYCDLRNSGRVSEAKWVEW